MALPRVGPDSILVWYVLAFDHQSYSALRSQLLAFRDEPLPLGYEPRPLCDEPLDPRRSFDRSCLPDLGPFSLLRRPSLCRLSLRAFVSQRLFEFFDPPIFIHRPTRYPGWFGCRALAQGAVRGGRRTST